MSAEVLREAAALMRERAEAATPGLRGWDVWNHKEGERRFSVTTHDETAHDIAEYLGSNVAPPEGDGEMTVDEEAEWAIDRREQAKADARFDASWHPAVALAVADWLDMVADKGATNIRPEWYVLGWDNALAVARAYLGSDQ